MDGINNMESIPRPQEFDTLSHQVKFSTDDWHSKREEIRQLYTYEDHTLEDVMAVFRDKYGLNAKKRTWEAKLSELKIPKNIPSDVMQPIVAINNKRKREGKETEFSHKIYIITKERIAKFEKRNTIHVLSNAPTPSDLDYQTPRPDVEDAFSEDVNDHPMAFHSPLSPASSLSRDYTNSAEMFISGSQCTHKTKADIPDTGSYSSLDRWFEDALESQPWCALRPPQDVSVQFRNLVRHAKLNEYLLNINEILNISRSEPSVEWSSSSKPDTEDTDIFLSGMGDRWISQLENNLMDNLPAYRTCLSIDGYQGDGTSEAAASENFVGITKTFAEFQNQHGKSATVKQEFKFAQALERNEYYAEAGYHYFHVLSICTEPDVKCYFGFMLEKTSRKEESKLMLFSAITDYIIQFDLFSVSDSVTLFHLIEKLYSKLVESDWESLSTCLESIDSTVKAAIYEETVDQLCPQLYLYGFLLAYECSKLDLVESAKYILKNLLEHSVSQLDTTQHGLELAIAHQRYGLLLRREGQWKSSAEQLLSACRCATKSGKHNIELFALFEQDSKVFLQHLPFATQTDNSFTEELRVALMQYQLLCYVPDQDTLGTSRNSHNDKDLAIASPVPLANLEALSLSDVIMPTRGSDEKSTSISSGSYNKIGISYSESEITGTSDMVLEIACGYELRCQ